MKHWLLILIAAISLNNGFSQTENPPYKQNKNLPSFKIQTVNKGMFTSDKLKKNSPVIIMFFSPGCDHCIHQFEDMRKRMNDLKNYQIVMATWQPIEELAEFNKKYRISQYTNITTGRDVDYFFPPFFEIGNFPYLAFYNKSGKLISTHEGNMSIDNILQRFK
jgi:thiol-disulfide isomerase/thioredoxin